MGEPEGGAERIGGLWVTRGPDAGLIIGLGDAPAVVGRETGCEVRLTDPSVSRRHFQIGADADGRWTIEDLRSANGTFVGEERVERAGIAVGVEITVGETVLQVLSEEQAEGSLRRRTARVADPDPVTQVYTREMFEMRLRTEVALAGRTGAVLSVALVEIDRARALEDREPGVLMRVLPVVALKLTGLLRDSDLLARFDDETVVAFLADPQPMQAYVTAERMCTAVQTITIPVAQRPTPMTASVGLATDKGRRDLTLGELLGRARGQLELAREAGGNCVSRWVHLSARDRLPARSTDLAPTALDQARKTKIIRGSSLASGPQTIPPPPRGGRSRDDPDELL
jgi:diguanylate cyclase (GGDEF)-like protein